MSKSDLNAVMAQLNEMNKEEVKTPSVPVSIYIQEAEDQKVWAEEDKKVLLAHGLKPAYLENMPVRSGALREAQSIWAREYKSREDAEKEWHKSSPATFLLRDKLLDAFRYAFRKDKELLTKVQVIGEGGSREDMIQDLNDLAVLGRANASLLQEINFDMKLLDQAAQLADQMAELLARAKGEGNKDSDELDIRNRAYTYLKEAVDEIRDCGKYAFADNPERLKGYRSEYLRKYRNKAKQTIEEML